MQTLNTIGAVEFRTITDLLKLPKLNSSQITTLSNVILNANQEKAPLPLSFQELEERITILGKIDNNIVMPERTWYLHIFTFFISYVFLKNFDDSRATDILQQKQNLIQKYREQYLEPLFAAADSDSNNVGLILNKLETCDSSYIKEILKYGLKNKNKEIIAKCRERLRNMPLHDRYAFNATCGYYSTAGNHTYITKDSRRTYNLITSGPSEDFTSFVKEIIESGADIDIQPYSNSCWHSCWGSSWLIFCAVAHNNNDAFYMLLEAGAEYKNKSNVTVGVSLLSMAVRNRNEKIILTLMNAGIKDNKALITAAFIDNTDFISAYLKLGVDDSIKTEALRTAINYQSNKAALCLINAGADVNVVEQNGQSAAWLAVRRKDFDLLKGIQKKDGRADLITYALFTAIQLNYEDMYAKLMKALSSSTINLKNYNDNENTLLMTAVVHGQTSMVRALIDQGAKLGIDLNATNKEGYTALMLAIKHNRVDIPLILIQNGARCNLATPSGETALSLATKTLTPPTFT